MIPKITNDRTSVYAITIPNAKSLKVLVLYKS